jgi:ComF family protein
MEEGQNAWCAACDPLVARLRDPLCPVCHRFLSGIDFECPSSHPVASLTTLVALGLFDRAWRSVVHAFKYHGHKALAVPLGEMLSEFVAQYPGANGIIAVPTDARKLGERGFGHAELLARTVARRTGLPFFADGLRHTRRIPDQTRLTGRQRMQNLKGAFAVPDPELVEGKAVIVVDDVTTTGATLREATRALSTAGAKSVVGAVIAANFGNLSDGR